MNGWYPQLWELCWWFVSEHIFVDATILIWRPPAFIKLCRTLETTYTLRTIITHQLQLLIKTGTVILKNIIMYKWFTSDYLYLSGFHDRPYSKSNWRGFQRNTKEVLKLVKRVVSLHKTQKGLRIRIEMIVKSFKLISI